MPKGKDIVRSEAPIEGELPGGGLVLPSIKMTPAIKKLLAQEDISPSEKRRKLLVTLGIRQPRKKYKTLDARKEASKTRREKRKKDRLGVFEAYGIKPREKGTKMTKEQKAEKRSSRGKKRRSFMREMAKKDPTLAKQYGIDPSRFKL